MTAAPAAVRDERRGRSRMGQPAGPGQAMVAWYDNGTQTG